jgi:hypothetical protein
LFLRGFFLDDGGGGGNRFRCKVRGRPGGGRLSFPFKCRDTGVGEFALPDLELGREELGGGTRRRDSRMSRERPASMKSWEEALRVASMTLLYTGAFVGG